MKVKTVLKKYHGLVPFPWSTNKIRNYGYDPATLMRHLGQALEQCEDGSTDTCKEVITYTRKSQG